MLGRVGQAWQCATRRCHLPKHLLELPSSRNIGRCADKGRDWLDSLSKPAPGRCLWPSVLKERPYEKRAETRQLLAGHLCSAAGLSAIKRATAKQRVAMQHAMLPYTVSTTSFMHDRPLQIQTHYTLHKHAHQDRKTICRSDHIMQHAGAYILGYVDMMRWQEGFVSQ